MDMMELATRMVELEQRLASLEKHRPLTPSRIADIEAEHGRGLEEIFREEAALGQLSLGEFAESLGITRHQARYWCDRLGLAWQRTQANRSHQGNPRIADLNRARAWLQVTVDGATMTLADYCRRTGIPYRRIYSRMYRYDLTADEAIRYQGRRHAAACPSADHPWRSS